MISLSGSTFHLLLLTYFNRMMKRLHRIAGIVTLFLAGTALMAMPLLAQEAADRTDEAREAAEEWLALFDDGDIEATWEEASSYFQQQVDQEDWVRQAEAGKQQTGELDGRTFADINFADELPQAPEGEYMILNYNTQYAQVDVVETVILRLEDDVWRVIGFFAQPQDTPGQ